MKKNDVRIIVKNHFQEMNVVCSDYHLGSILDTCYRYKIDLTKLESILIFLKENNDFFEIQLSKYSKNLAFYFSIYCNAIYEKKEKYYNHIDYERLLNVINHGMPLMIADDMDNEIRESYEEIISELNSLIGLDNIKREISDLANLAVINKEKIKHNLPVNSNTLHLVFKGNPGTGKTTVARLIGKIYKSIGLLESGHLVEVSRHDIVAKYIGHTAKLVEEKFLEAKNGVLFIDEAYTLSTYNNSNDFGQEAIQTILKLMEDYRTEIVVIVAGYPNEMDLFLSSNPGLKSRFSNVINFEDYKYSELVNILLKLIKDDMNKLTNEAYHKINYIFEEHFTNQGTSSNARFIRNYYDQILKVQASRLSKYKEHTYDSLRTIVETDIIDI